MKLNKYFCLLPLIAFSMVSCGNMDDTYKQFIVPEGVVYTQKTKNAKAFSGFKRIKLTWLKPVDPNVIKTRIYWNNYTDSVEFNTPTGIDTINYILNIPEGFYSFYLKNWDADGNSSVPVEVQARSYGELFMESLTNRSIKNALISQNKLNIRWNDADLYNGSIGQEFYYIDNAGNEKKLFLPASESSTILSDYKTGTDLKYRTLFLADTTCIDTLKTDLTVYVSSKILIQFDKSKFKEVWLDNDSRAREDWGWYLRNIWDGRTNSDPGYHSYDILPSPVHVTFDTNTTMSLKQMRMWQRTDWGVAYSGGNPKTFSVWGSNNPTQDGSWNAWTKLSDFVSETHNLTEGELFNFPEELPAFRYYRIEVYTVWGANNPAQKAVSIMEIELYGSM